ncbi:MAG: hypothetical protein ACYCZU_10275 [Devosia sp.]
MRPSMVQKGLPMPEFALTIGLLQIVGGALVLVGVLTPWARREGVAADDLDDLFRTHVFPVIERPAPAGRRPGPRSPHRRI